MRLHQVFSLLLCLNFPPFRGEASSLNETMAKLIDLIHQEQVLKPSEFHPPTWAQKLGLFRSEIRIDFYGEPAQAELRKNKNLYIFDNNMFATGWISTVLLEANMYGRAPPTIDDAHLSLAVDAIEKFHDRNQEAAGVPLMTFWSQVYNETTRTWQSIPDNLNALVTFGEEDFEVLEKWLDKLGIENIAVLLGKVAEVLSHLDDAFHIPPDFDDTYLNIGLGVQLKLLEARYPSLYQRWLQTNSNMKALVELTLRYAYQPSSEQLDRSTIDPRTYFWLREFVRENPQATLVTTWAQNISEVREFAHRGVRMPFNLNNVDVTVGANVLYGITSAIVYDLLDFHTYFNAEMQNLYLSTGQLIAWAIKHAMMNRPDLAQVYYPSHYNFLWYGSRTLFLLENSRQANRTLPEVCQRLYSVLADVYRTDVLQDLRTHVRADHSSYEEFLGTNDTNVFGRPEPTGEDRIFSTAQAINVLISSFTFFDPTSQRLKWIAGDPKELQSVQTMIKQSIGWLQNNVLAYQPFNCFFSGSVKGFNQLPFWYPANVYQYLNGSALDPARVNLKNQSLIDTVVGVRGSIEEAVYQRMINQTHFNISTPTTFPGYNVPRGEFPFWSSPPYTYSVSLLALAQYNNLDL